MIAQVRIYTINKGMLDDWIRLFNEQLAPLHEKYGIEIVGAWANRPQNEFVWVRAFEDERDMESKTKAYYASPERDALGDLPGTFLAKLEVRDVDYVFDPAPAPVERR